MFKEAKVELKGLKAKQKEAKEILKAIKNKLAIAAGEVRI